MTSYHNNPEATREVFDSEGWFKTGDVATYDKDGFFSIVDRLKELIKVKGLQVRCSEDGGWCVVVVVQFSYVVVFKWYHPVFFIMHEKISQGLLYKLKGKNAWLVVLKEENSKSFKKSKASLVCEVSWYSSCDSDLEVFLFNYHTEPPDTQQNPWPFHLPIKNASPQVSPSELEDVLLSYPGVAEVGVVGVPDEKAGEVPRAYVVPQGKDLKKDELNAFVAARVAPHKQLAGGIEFVEQLPKNPTGKLLRKELRKMAHGE